MRFCQKLKTYHPYICGTQCRKSLIFQTMNSMNYEKAKV